MMTTKEFYIKLHQLTGIFLDKFNIQELPYKYNREQCSFIREYIQDLQSNTITDEVWYEIKGYDSPIRISTCGKVVGNKRNKPIKIQVNPYGYLKIGVRINGKLTSMFMHRELAKIFHGSPEDYRYVDHINNIPFDYNWKNLRWLSNIENTRCSHRRTDLYRGVRVNRNRFSVSIKHNNITKMFGTYKNEIDAAYVSDIATKRLHPSTRSEFLNNIKEGELKTPVKQLLEKVDGYFA